MIRLTDNDTYFTELTAIGVVHIAQLHAYHWHTMCGRRKHKFSVSQLTVREMENDDPDTRVCQRCIQTARIADVIEVLE